MTLLMFTACGGESSTGSLEAVIDPEGATSGFGDFTTGRDKSFGIFVCSVGGAVELNDIEPISQEGGVEFLGAMIYTSADQFVGAATGYPADGLDENKLEPLEGATVDIECDEPDGDERVQILVGAERTSIRGGMIEGIRVSTSDGDVDIDYTILLCGDELEYCEFLNEDSA